MRVLSRVMPPKRIAAAVAGAFGRRIRPIQHLVLVKNGKPQAHTFRRL